MRSSAPPKPGPTPSRLVGFESGLRLVAALPNSRLLLLNRCGHRPQTEHADDVARGIDSLLGHTINRH